MTQTTNQTTQRKDIHQLVTDRIVQQLEKGNIPWYKPWQVEGAAHLNFPVTRSHKTTTTGSITCFYGAQRMKSSLHRRNGPPLNNGLKTKKPYGRVKKEP